MRSDITTGMPSSEGPGPPWRYGCGDGHGNPVIAKITREAQVQTGGGAKVERSPENCGYSGGPSSSRIHTQRDPVKMCSVGTSSPGSSIKPAVTAIWRRD